MNVSIKRRSAAKPMRKLHSNVLLNRLLNFRGIESAEELNFALADLPRPDTLLGIDVAVARLVHALEQQERVLIVGDYDCDGATSTALAVLVLRAMQFTHVDFLVPNRFEYGYGLSPAIVDVAAKASPSLILTVDNGVASVDGVEAARDKGIDVIVTDHHLAPAVLPRAVAIVNPNIPGATFPSGNLAGVGVCFYVMLALRAALAKQNLPGGSVNLAEYLDLVAIGTVADVVPLDHVNRVLVEQGLRRIRRGMTRPGVKALFSRAGRDIERIAAADIGYALGPRLNAAGRIDDMTKGIDCLLTDSDADALTLATELDTLNQKRRSIETSMREEAARAIELLDQSTDVTANSFSIVLFKEDWHQGVIGIVAGRLKDSLHKPVVIFAADDSNSLKGSARSIPGVHIRDVLDAVATNNPDLIDKFGGHAMAAGLSLQKRRFSEFVSAFEKEVKRVLNAELPAKEIESDGGLEDEERTLANARLLSHVCPWGQAFPPPVFDDYFTVEQARVVGNGHLKLRLLSDTPSESDKAGSRFDAIAFNQPDTLQPGDRVHVAYSLTVNHYRNAESVQLNVQHIQIPV